MKIWVLAVALAALAVFGGRAEAQTETRCRVSMAQYTQVQSGWTYNQVRDLFGCDGIEMSSSDIAGYRTVMYMWSGRGSLGANLNVMFQNGRMMQKAQFGLR